MLSQHDASLHADIIIFFHAVTLQKACSNDALLALQLLASGDVRCLFCVSILPSPCTLVGGLWRVPCLLTPRTPSMTTCNAGHHCCQGDPPSSRCSDGPQCAAGHRRTTASPTTGSMVRVWCSPSPPPLSPPSSLVAEGLLPVQFTGSMVRVRCVCVSLSPSSFPHRSLLPQYFPLSSSSLIYP
jgi:hypothetical protein